jgi:hypothetical protein
LEWTVICKVWLFSLTFFVVQLLPYAPVTVGALAAISFFTEVAVLRTAFS